MSQASSHARSETGHSPAGGPPQRAEGPEGPDKAPALHGLACPGS